MYSKREVLFLVNGGILLILLPMLLLLPSDKQSQPPIEPEPELYMDNEPALSPVLETIDEYGSLTIMASLIKEAGLTEELTGDGPYSVLVPDDSAFSQLQPEQLERLMSDREFLQKVLARHIVVGHRVEFGEENETLTLKTLNGELITVDITDEGVKVEQAWIIDEQIECSNGVVHVIDAVLLPHTGKQKG